MTSPSMQATELTIPNSARSAHDHPALAAAQAAGVHLAHLRRNLTLTPAERLARLQAGIRLRRTLLIASSGLYGSAGSETTDGG